MRAGALIKFAASPQAKAFQLLRGLARVAKNPAQMIEAGLPKGFALHTPAHPRMQEALKTLGGEFKDFGALAAKSVPTDVGEQMAGRYRQLIEQAKRLGNLDQVPGTMIPPAPRPLAHQALAT